jgi:hypothetical protein
LGRRLLHVLCEPRSANKTVSSSDTVLEGTGGAHKLTSSLPCSPPPFFWLCPPIPSGHLRRCSWLHVVVGAPPRGRFQKLQPLSRPSSLLSNTRRKSNMGNEIGSMMCCDGKRGGAAGDGPMRRSISPSVDLLNTMDEHRASTGNPEKESQMGGRTTLAIVAAVANAHLPPARQRN